MADHKVKHSGTWKSPSQISAKVLNTWVEVEKVFVKQGGSWVEVYASSKPPIWTAGVSASETTQSGFASASIALSTNGAITLYSGTNGTWLPSGASNSDYRVKFEHTGGTPPNGGTALNNWYSLSSARSVQLSATTGLLTSNVRITIEETATGAQIVRNCTLSAYVTGGGGGGEDPF